MNKEPKSPYRVGMEPTPQDINTLVAHLHDIAERAQRVRDAASDTTLHILAARLQVDADSLACAVLAHSNAAENAQIAVWAEREGFLVEGRRHLDVIGDVLDVVRHQRAMIAKLDADLRDARRRRRTSKKK